jgi:hypothetical protein
MIFALDRLKTLRAGKNLDSPCLTDINDLHLDLSIEFEERAAILEYKGELSREDADRKALTGTVVRIGRFE